MPRLVWDKVGDRRFETGVDRGVLFTTNGVGVPWNGLTSVKESLPGAEISSFFLDGLKYLQTIGRAEFEGTIEAFTYPDEFAIHDGTQFIGGLIVGQQRRKQFAFSYRTRVGNDVNGADNGYKLHIVYNALAQPTEKQYGTMNSSAEAATFSWSFTTVSQKPNADGNYAPLAHLIIDSTKAVPWTLRYVEERIYGSESLSPRLLSIDEIFALFENPQLVLSIFSNPARGLNQLVYESDGTGDLFGDPEEGLYKTLSETRIIPTNTVGYYKLDPAKINVTNGLIVADTADTGTYNTYNGIVSETTTTDPGTFTVNQTTKIKPDATDPGTFVIGA